MPSDRSRCAGIGLLAAMLLAGCGEGPGAGRLAVFPAGGSVLVRGEPAEGARVMLHPADPGVAAAGLFPHSTADASGAFALTTYEAGDGAPAGRYRVSVTRPDPGFVPKTPEQREAVALGEPAPDLLRGRYADPSRSGLEAEIVADGDGSATVLPTFDLR
ncbi:carboxypeptidase-like regulatory domain-containing protein [Tautonia plasticadhaerens]|uniref:Carboxypeptidase regulatory-like domain-containing protein n=1 Tax=Tautonia plasticadhaerens TaxID=2527974 RepID=A0A518GV70_9BACT|nr:carboxypeptidase-like regulatory domain-containing protein [Tautonia plasticadhaerens]QDV32479.1 hypothetical protein ElP_03120 [Tautonia plasticadhaerens]